MSARKNTEAPTVSIIGAGNVGATLAQRLLEHDLATVVLLDIREGLAQAKACDLSDAAAIMGYETTITGTADYSHIQNSSIVVITAGIPRSPGMTREELLKKNGDIVRGVCEKIAHHAPESIVIVVTNPLDIMVYLARAVTGFPRERVIGMAGVLDSSRLAHHIAVKKDIAPTETDCIVIGSHDTHMIPLFGYSTAQGHTLDSLFSPQQLDEIRDATRTRGAQIVGLMQSGSAFYAPSAACYLMIKSILENQHITVSASVCLEGEYGLSGIALGVPVTLGKDGAHVIDTYDLSDEPKRQLKESAVRIQKVLREAGYDNEGAGSS